MNPSYNISWDKCLEVCVAAHVILCMFITPVLARPLPFLANRNTELADSPFIFWASGQSFIEGHVAQLSFSCPTFYFLYSVVYIHFSLSKCHRALNQNYINNYT